MESFGNTIVLLGKRLFGNLLGLKKPQEDLSELVNYECKCCYNEVPFDYLVQCDEGHLFCIECFQRYVHEAVYGQGQGRLNCFAEGCDKTFSESQIVRALPDALREKFDERVQEELLSVANLDNFYKCPFCSMGAIFDSDEDKYKCPKCFKVSCRLCSKDYHEGTGCHQVEGDRETKFRKEFEEKMAAVLIRKCPNCHVSFTKKTGCNKVSCRCGASICYVCRKSIAGYNHFCQHFRIPGMRCAVCSACSLYTNTDEDDQQAIEELKKAAERLRNNPDASQLGPQTTWSKIRTFVASFPALFRNRASFQNPDGNPERTRTKDD